MKICRIYGKWDMENQVVRVLKIGGMTVAFCIRWITWVYQCREADLVECFIMQVLLLPDMLKKINLPSAIFTLDFFLFHTSLFHIYTYIHVHPQHIYI